MSNDINGLDVHDEGLKGIFGDRFHDETENAQHNPTADEMKKNYNVAPKAEKTAQRAASKPRNAEWEPVPHEPTQMERLKACAKEAMIYGGLSALLFYFQQSGQMLPSAAMPCIIACALLMGFGIGKNFAGGK